VTERVLETRELNRALLARQLLLECSSLSVPDALEQVAGLQAQYAPSPYVGLWSRLRDFRRDQLTGGPRGPPGGAGDPAAVHHPRRLGGRLPAIRRRLEDEAERLAAFHRG
jgi:hypothetical protein